MDFVKNAMGGGDSSENKQQQTQGAQQPQSGGGGFLGGIGDKINSAAGGGRESEKNVGQSNGWKPWVRHLLTVLPITLGGLPRQG